MRGLYKEALHKYVDDPLGYFATPQEYYETVIKWEKERHGFDVKKEWICITPGIVPALYWAVKTYVKPGEAVIINTPVYYPFKNAIPCRRLQVHRVSACGNGPYIYYRLRKI